MKVKQHRLAGRAGFAVEHHAQVGLDVSADVLGMAVALGVHDELAGLLAHAVLELVGLRQAAGEVEAHHQFIEVSRHEGGADLPAVIVRGGQIMVVGVDHLLLQPHRVLLLDLGDGLLGGLRRRHLDRGAHAVASLAFVW